MPRLLYFEGKNCWGGGRGLQPVPLSFPPPGKPEYADDFSHLRALGVPSHVLGF